MSDKPRIFISAVSSEFGQTRQDVANILMRLGYEPVLQDVFATETGDLRQMLRKKIDACDGLIQIVGQAYGFEPPTPDEEFGRVSYTQLEYLYARQKGKKRWRILTWPGYAADSALDQIDLPLQPNHPDPIGYQAERRALQQRYRERSQKESDAWYHAADKIELQAKVERLREGVVTLRKELPPSPPTARRFPVTAVLLLAVVIGGLSWMTIHRLKEDPVAEALAALDPEVIRTRLVKLTLDASMEDPAHKRNVLDPGYPNLVQSDECVDSIARTIASGQATSEFLKLSSILQEQGIDEALAYLAKQEPRLFERANQLAASGSPEVRRTLAPLLEGVRLHRNWGDQAEAERLGEKLLAADADWPAALHQHILTIRSSGDRARRSEDVAGARSQFESAVRSAQRVLQLQPAGAEAQRDLWTCYSQLAYLFDNAGDFDAAIRNGEQGIAVMQRMVGNGRTAVKGPLEELKDWVAWRRQKRTAAGAWDELLKQPAPKLPELLKLRCHILAARGEIESVAQAAEALGNLVPKTMTNLYNAADGYGLCAKLAAGWPGHGPFPPPKGAPNAKASSAKAPDPKSDQKYRHAAIDLLQATVKAGYNRNWIQRDPDLDALRELPEFKKLLASAR